MADLISTISIQGSVGNQSVSWSHTATITDIVDAGTRLEADSEIIGYTAMDDNAMLDDLASPIFSQITPAYLFLKNDASSMPTLPQVKTSVVGIAASFYMVPGSCVILMDPNGIGMIGNSSTAVDVTLGTVSSASNRQVTLGIVGLLQVLTGLKA